METAQLCDISRHRIYPEAMEQTEVCVSQAIL